MRKRSLSTFILYVAIISILLSFLSMSFIWLYSTWRLPFKANLNSLYQKELKKQRLIVKDRNDSVVSRINTERRLGLFYLKSRLKNKVDTAYTAAYHIYNKYKNEKSTAEIKQLIKESLNNIGFGNNTVSGFVVDLKNSRFLNQTKQMTKDKDLVKLNNDKRKIVIDKGIKLVKEQKEGFFEDSQLEYNEYGEKKDHIRIVFVKLFEPFNWCIGSRVSLSNFREKEKLKIIKDLSIYASHVSHQKLSIAHLINIKGSSCFAEKIINSDKKELAIKCLSDETKNGKGFLFRKKYLKDLSMRGYSFAEYFYKTPGSDEGGFKLSYIRLYKPYNWIIETSMDIHDMKSYIMQNEHYIKQKMDHTIFLILLYTLIVAAVYILLAKLMANRAKKQLELFMYDIEQMIKNNKKVDTGKFKVDELYSIANHIAQLTKDKEQYYQSLLKEEKEHASLLKSFMQNERKFKTALKNLPIGIFMLDKDAKVIFANSAFENIMGYTQEELSHINIFSTIHKDFQKIAEKRFKHRIEGMNEISSYEMKVLRKDKKLIWVELFINEITLRGRMVFVYSVIDITDKKIKNDKVKYLSFHDVLTGLYNRYYFSEEIKRFSSERNQPLSIIMSDINGLKIVNDTMGHEKGDKIIVRFAEVLKSKIRSNDVAARVGGDEFAVIMPNTDEAGAEKFIRRLLDAVDYDNMQNEVYLSVSFGYATQKGQYKTLDDLLKKADLNMYSDKFSFDRKLHLAKVAESILKIRKENIDSSILNDIIQNAMERSRSDK